MRKFLNFVSFEVITAIPVLWDVILYHVLEDQNLFQILLLSLISKTFHDFSFYMCTQPGLILLNCFLQNFSLMQLENLHHFSKLRDDFWLTTLWHIRSIATLTVCSRLAKTDITAMPSITCMD
jgi:hypothetical protein